METAVLIGKTVSENIFPILRKHTPEIGICQIYLNRISPQFPNPEIIRTEAYLTCRTVTKGIKAARNHFMKTDSAKR